MFLIANSESKSERERERKRKRKREEERERDRDKERQYNYKMKTKKMSINNIERPRQGLSLLQCDNKNQTDAERRTIVMNKLEHWSRKNCFLSAGPRSKA